MYILATFTRYAIYLWKWLKHYSYPTFEMKTLKLFYNGLFLKLYWFCNLALARVCYVLKKTESSFKKYNNFRLNTKHSSEFYTSVFKWNIFNLNHLWKLQNVRRLYFVRYLIIWWQISCFCNWWDVEWCIWRLEFQSMRYKYVKMWNAT